MASLVANETFFHALLPSTCRNLTGTVNHCSGTSRLKQVKMEALVAIGLAGNVLQFVEFAGSLISETIKIKRSGIPSSIPHLKRLTDDLTKQASHVHKCLATNTNTESIAQEDQVCATTLSQASSLMPQSISSTSPAMCQTWYCKMLKNIESLLGLNKFWQKLLGR